MSTGLGVKVLRASLALTLLFSVLPGPLAAAHPPVAPHAGIPITIPFVNFIGAWIGRDRTYANAEEFITERNQYYDTLRKTLRAKFSDYLTAFKQGDPNAPKINQMRDSQVAAYVIQAGLIESQRASSLAFAEAVKKGARKNFNQALKQEIQERVMATGMLQQVFGAITAGLGASQTLINTLNDRLDQVPQINLELRQLRTLSDQLGGALGILTGPDASQLNAQLHELSARLRSKAGISREDLNQVSQQMGALKSRLQALSAPDQLALTSGSQLATDLGMQLLGFSQGTPATQAVLRLLSRRNGVSYEQIRARGLALLAAGDKARCQEKAAQIQKQLQILAAEQGKEVVIRAPAELCNEITPEKLLGNEPLPSKTDQSEPEAPENVDFNEDNCACGDFQLAKAEPWGSSSLSCTYEWTGPSGIKTQLEFEVSLYNENHLDDLPQNYQRELSDYRDRLAGAKPPDVGSVFLDDKEQSYFGMVITNPNDTTPLCGYGKGVYNYNGNYLIRTSMVDACDLGADSQAYIAAMQTLAECAMGSVDGRYP